MYVYIHIDIYTCWFLRNPRWDAPAFSVGETTDLLIIWSSFVLATPSKLNWLPGHFTLPYHQTWVDFSLAPKPPTALPFCSKGKILGDSRKLGITKYMGKFWPQETNSKANLYIRMTNFHLTMMNFLLSIGLRVSLSQAFTSQDQYVYMSIICICGCVIVEIPT